MFRSCVFVILTLFFFCQFSLAQSLPLTPLKSFFKPFEIGVQVENYRYVEPGLISHFGLLFGLRGVAAWSYNEKASGLVLGDINSGELNYDGALCDVNTNVCTAYQAKTRDVILRLTHRFDYLLTDTFHLFIGPGFRYLIDQGRGAGFYTRRATYFFVPAGFAVDFAEYTFEFEYDFFMKGRITSHLSEVNSSFGDMSHSQENGLAYRATVLRHFKNLVAVPLIFGLYYEKREVPSSEFKELIINNLPSGKFYKEPRNLTEVIGLRASLLY